MFIYRASTSFQNDPAVTKPNRKKRKFSDMAGNIPRATQQPLEPVASSSSADADQHSNNKKTQDYFHGIILRT